MVLPKNSNKKTAQNDEFISVPLIFMTALQLFITKP